MNLLKFLIFLSLLMVQLAQSKPTLPEAADPLKEQQLKINEEIDNLKKQLDEAPIPEKGRDEDSKDVDLRAYTIDYFLVRKELEYALQDVISYKEASTSIIDPLTDPEPEVATQTRFMLEALRVTAFYAYDKLIFLSRAQLLTLAYATQTFGWYDKAFTHFTDRIVVLIEDLDDTTRDNLQLLLNQIITQTNLHEYNVKLLLTPD